MAHGPDTTPGGSGDFRSGTTRGATGYFHLAQHRCGQWWLLDADERPVFLRGVHAVRNTRTDTDTLPARDPTVRLRAWGFNTVGVGGDGSGRDDGMPFLANAGFCSVVPMIVAPGVRLPDVFEPDWSHRVWSHAALACAGHAPTRELVGWVTDADLAWGYASASGKPGLLQTCLSLEPSFAAYHGAWEFVLALHGGTLDHVARAWGVELANKEVVREMTRAEVGVATRGYVRDEGRWAREFASRYVTATTAAIRAADPNHLVCGPRFTAPVGAHLLHAVSPAVDVPLVHWAELPPAGAGPVIAGELGWSDQTFWAAASPTGTARRSGRITSIEWMLRRARTVLRLLARHPAVVGYLWRDWHDEPGEQPPFARGLVHVNGAEAREHTELLTEFNGRAEALRRSAAKQLSP